MKKYNIVIETDAELDLEALGRVMKQLNGCRMKSIREVKGFMGL